MYVRVYLAVLNTPTLVHSHICVRSICVLQEYSARYGLELLSLPLDSQYSERRAQGLQLLRRALWAPPAGTTITTEARASVVNSMRMHATAAEQVRKCEMRVFQHAHERMAAVPCTMTVLHGTPAVQIENQVACSYKCIYNSSTT